MPPYPPGTFTSWIPAFIGFILAIFHLVISILAIGGVGYMIQFLRLKKASKPQIRSFSIISVPTMVIFITVIFFSNPITLAIIWNHLYHSLSIWELTTRITFPLICAYISLLVLRDSNEKIPVK